MKLIKASTEIITPINGEEILKRIELAARTCYKSEDKIGTFKICNGCKAYNSDGQMISVIEECKYGKVFEHKFCTAQNEKVIGIVSHIDLVNRLIQNKHEAMLEFGGNVTVKFICDRGVSHELVRHRLASFAQESTRYCNYGKDEHISFIIPSWMNWNEGECTKATYSYINVGHDGHNTWLNAMLDAEDRYNTLIKKGQSPQQARSVLPNSLKTEINVSANIREWRHILKLRIANAAHPDMQYLMRPLLDEFKEQIPILFNDINY